MGYGPGIALYTVFGAFALYSGFQIYNVFIHLDSDRYPMKSFGDTFFRVYGRWARHFVNICQAIQLLLTVSILILSNGQSISQISKGTLCFIACLVIFMAAGFVVGQVRTLQRFGWLANFAVWINVLILFIWYVCSSIYLSLDGELICVQYGSCCKLITLFHRDTSIVRRFVRARSNPQVRRHTTRWHG